MTPDEQLAALCTPTEEEIIAAAGAMGAGAVGVSHAVLRLAVPRIAAQVLRDAIDQLTASEAAITKGHGVGVFASWKVLRDLATSWEQKGKPA